MQTAVVDLATNTFCADGSFAALPNHLVVTVAATPLPRTQRYSGDPKNPVREATDVEIAAFDAAQKDAAAQVAIDASVDVKAAVITALWGRLGRQPTGQEIATERARFIVVRKSL